MNYYLQDDNLLEISNTKYLQQEIAKDKIRQRNFYKALHKSQTIQRAKSGSIAYRQTQEGICEKAHHSVRNKKDTTYKRLRLISCMRSADTEQ